jgi:hypothetical protein
VIERIEVVVEIMKQMLLLTLGGKREADVVSAPAPALGSPRAGSLRERIPELLRQEGRPLKAAVIARKLGRTSSGHFREVLLGLVEEGKVVRCPGATYGVPGTTGPSSGTSP